MSTKITKFVKDLDSSISILEAADQLLCAQIDANENDDEGLRDHFEGSTNLMLDRAINSLSDILDELCDYRSRER